MRLILVLRNRRPLSLALSVCVCLSLSLSLSLCLRRSRDGCQGQAFQSFEHLDVHLTGARTQGLDVKRFVPTLPCGLAHRFSMFCFSWVSESDRRRLHKGSLQKAAGTAINLPSRSLQMNPLRQLPEFTMSILQ